jgi:hypothetical protein
VVAALTAAYESSACPALPLRGGWTVPNGRR